MVRDRADQILSASGRIVRITGNEEAMR